jgi:hypothetical protein
MRLKKREREGKGDVSSAPCDLCNSLIVTLLMRHTAILLASPSLRKIYSSHSVSQRSNQSASPSDIQC